MTAARVPRHPRPTFPAWVRGRRRCRGRACGNLWRLEVREPRVERRALRHSRRSPRARAAPGRRQVQAGRCGPRTPGSALKHRSQSRAARPLHHYGRRRPRRRLHSLRPGAGPGPTDPNSPAPPRTTTDVMQLPPGVTRPPPCSVCSVGALKRRQPKEPPQALDLESTVREAGRFDTDPAFHAGCEGFDELVLRRDRPNFDVVEVPLEV
jgi:hypothetical protein